MVPNDCKQFLTIDRVTHAFKNNLHEISNRIVSCFYTCFQQVFTRWAVIVYDKYPEDFITFIANTSFTDSILKFKENVLIRGLYQSDASLKTIIFSFYKNKLRENLQREKRLLAKQKNIAVTSDSLYVTGEKEFETRESLHLSLEQALAKMDPQDRQIIQWRHVDEKSNEEIAALLGITKESATNRIYRCMQRLRQLIENIS